MSLAHIADAFDGVTDLPIEIPEVQDVVQRLGIQDEIVCVPANSDPFKCRGVFYQFTKRDGVYGEPVLVTLIVYSENLDIRWQRVICTKEIIHVTDRQAEKTHTPEEVTGLVDKLLGPLSTEDYGLADLQAAIDKLAMYQALIILFPDSARDEARQQIAAGNRTVEQVAEWASLPLPLVKFALDDDWPEVKEELLGFGKRHEKAAE